jgi:hypothetical protein
MQLHCVFSTRREKKTKEVQYIEEVHLHPETRLKISHYFDMLGGLNERNTRIFEHTRTLNHLFL